MLDTARERNLTWGSAAAFAVELQFDRLLASQYYELRLASGASQVDYLAAFSRRDASELAACVSNGVASNPEYRARGWDAIECFLSDWAAGTSFSAQRTPLFWFEYDDYENQLPGAVPSVSVCLLPFYSISAPVPERLPDDYRHAREVLGLLHAPCEASVHLATAFEALPANGRWIHLSYMLGRPRRALKLYGTMPRSELAPFLEGIGWAGDHAAIGQALQQLYPAALLSDELYLDLNLDDFRDAKHCSLGLAVSQQHLWRGLDHDQSRGAILAGWTAAGLCDPCKVQDVMRWPSSQPPRRHAFFREQRYLDVKLVWRAAKGWHAKAYLGRTIHRGPF